MKFIACVRIWPLDPTRDTPFWQRCAVRLGGGVSPRSPTIFRLINRTTPGNKEQEKNIAGQPDRAG